LLGSKQKIRRPIQFKLKFIFILFLVLGLLLHFIGNSVRQLSIANDLVKGGGSYNVDAFGNVIKITIHDTNQKFIKRISELRKLKSITITNQDLAEKKIDVSLLLGIRSLSSMAIVGLEIQNSDALGEFKFLNELSLYGSCVNGNIQFVERLSELKMLELTGVAVQDYSHLRELRKLKTLVLDKGSFDLNDVETIQGWLPKCEIMLV
jgi:hypothetical protein